MILKNKDHLNTDKVCAAAVYTPETWHPPSRLVNFYYLTGTPFKDQS